MTVPPAARERLRAIASTRDEDLDLFESALALAAVARPHVPEEPYRRHIATLIDETRVYAGGAPAPLALQLEALRTVVVRRFGYGGDEDVFEDIDAANLMHVIDRRRGLPVVLGLIVIHVARAVGWAADGLDFPGRFLVRLESGPNRIVIDPLEALAELQPFAMRMLLKSVAGNQAELTPELFAPMANRAILVRIQNNIKVRLLRARRLEDALPVVETLTLMTPDDPAPWREAGLIHVRLGHVDAAIEALENYLLRAESETGRYRVSLLLKELRERRPTA